MTSEIIIRTYRPEDLPALVAFINDAGEFERLERATTLEQTGHEMGLPDRCPATHCLLACANGRWVASAPVSLGQA